MLLKHKLKREKLNEETILQRLSDPMTSRYIQVRLQYNLPACRQESFQRLRKSSGSSTQKWQTQEKIPCRLAKEPSALLESDIQMQQKITATLIQATTSFSDKGKPLSSSSS